MSRSNTRRRRRAPYSKGEANRLIDSLLHPLFDRDPTFRLIDGILHGLVEQNLTETGLKFLQYNLRKIIRELR